MNEGPNEESAVCLLWMIRNLSHWNINLRGRTLKSPLFNSKALPGGTWYLKLTPRGEIKGDAHLHVYLVLFRGEVTYPINCEMSFIDFDGLYLAAGNVQNQVHKKHKSIKLSPCLTQEEVFLDRNSPFLPNDTLTVQCVIRMSHAFHPAVNAWISFFTDVFALTQTFKSNFENFSTHGLNTAFPCLTCIIFEKNIDVSINMNIYFIGQVIEESRVHFDIEVTNRELLVINFKVFVKDEKEKGEKPKKSVEINQIFKKSKTPKIVKLPPFLKRRDLRIYLQGDVLPLYGEVTIVTGDYDETIETNKKVPISEK